METRDWAMIAFTILTQMAVGAFIVLGIVHTYAIRKRGMEEADRLSDRALISIVLVVGVAMVASLFHLGNPLNAPRTIVHVADSWLSREILSVVLFALLALIFAAMQFFKVSTFAVRNIIAWIAAITGVFLVYAMSNIYQLPTEPAWDTFFTPISFFTTALLLGSLAIGAAFVVNYSYVNRKDPSCAEVQCELMRGSLRGIAVASILLLGVALVVLPLYVALLSTRGPAALSSVQLLVESYGGVLLLRLLLLFVGAGVFGILLYQNASSVGRERIAGYLAYTAFSIVFVAEVMGRFLFYATRVRIGV